MCRHAAETLTDLCNAPRFLQSLATNSRPTLMDKFDYVMHGKVRNRIPGLGSPYADHVPAFVLLDYAYRQAAHVFILALSRKREGRKAPSAMLSFSCEVTWPTFSTPLPLLLPFLCFLARCSASLRAAWVGSPEHGIPQPAMGANHWPSISSVPCSPQPLPPGKPRLSCLCAAGVQVQG
jgi:hypothetical protein